MRWLYILSMRLRSLITRNRLERDLDEEFRYHLERYIEEGVSSGLTTEDARCRALRAMDGYERRKEECRDMRRTNFVDNLLQDLRYGFRNLRRNPGFTAAALLTLALGVGVNVAVFAVVEAVLLRPLPYSDANRLVILNHRDSLTGITKEFIAIGDYLDLVKRQSAFEQVSGYGSVDGFVSGLGEPFRVTGLTAGPGLLETLRAAPVLGRGLTADDSRPGAMPVVILGYELWQTRFGSDPNIIGRGIRMGQRERQVVGVAPPGFHFPPNARTEVVVPLLVPVEAPAERKSDWTFAIGRLKPGMAMDTAAADLATISLQMEREHPRANQGSLYFPLSLRDALVGNTKPALILLFAAAAVVLLVACANVANLMLARALARQREMAVRMALGALRGRLIRQMLTESLALALAAGAVGVLIARWGARALVVLIPKSLIVPGIHDVRINGSVLAFTLLISVLTAVVFGLISALTVRSGSASQTLAERGRGGMSTAARRVASALVISEVALAIVLLIGAGLILRSFSRLLAVDPGFSLMNVMTMDVRIPADRYRSVEATRLFYNNAVAALGRIEDIQEIGNAAVTPLSGNNWTTTFERADQPGPADQRPPTVGWQRASGGYFKALQIPLIAGRLFDERDGSNGKPVVIISEAVQRLYFPHENAIGREVKQGKDRFEIVGVVGNIRRAGLRDQPRADLYFPSESGPGNASTLFVRTTSDPLKSVAAIRSTLRSIEPNIIFGETRTLMEIAGESVRDTELALWLLGVFAATALTLAAVGIYGVMSYVVRQRIREIGTRVALGATQRDIVWLVMRQGAGIALIGIAIGLGVGLLAARSLVSLLYGISASDPATLAAASVLLVATTMLACYLPARRAAGVDPVRTLSEQ